MVPIYYHFDREQKLQAGHILELRAYPQTPMDRLFPAGITPHGRRYLQRDSIVAGRAPDGEGITRVVSAIETVWEWVRETRHPDAPSRFQSVFACDSVLDAKAMAQFFGGPGDVWEVEVAVEGLRADMALLDFRSIAHSHQAADDYWSSLPSSHPRWERLLTPPVSVRRQIR